jgi:hypothetical protein
MKYVIATAFVAGAVLGLAATGVSAASLVSAKKLEVDVDAAKVEAERVAMWEKVGGWCAIAEWHPAIAKCEASKDGDTEFRTLTLKDGGVIKEKLIEKGSTSYKYEIVESPLPVKNYTAMFSVTPDDDDLDEINVVWSATYDSNGKEDKEARKIIDGIFKDGLDSIKSKHAGAPGKDDDAAK